MNRLRQFLAGRYGMDALSTLLLFFSALIFLVLRFTPWPWLALAGYAPLIIVLIRGFSRNFDARRRENAVLLRILQRFRSGRQQMQDKEHRYYNCPACGTTLRVPKGKGKIRITCNVCAREFVRDTGKPKKAKPKK